MRTLIFSFISIVFTSGCQRLEVKSPSESAGETAMVSFNILADQQHVITRQVDENGIYDLNIYLFGEYNSTSLHLFTLNTNPVIQLPFDNYQVFIVANFGESTGPLSLIELFKTNFGYNSMGSIPMSGQTTFAVKPENGREQVMPDVHLERNVARIDYQIQVSPSVPQLSIHSAQFLNIPKNVFPFAHSGSPSDIKEDYYNSGITNLNEYKKTFSGRIFLNENLQGNNPEILSEKDKTHDKAPLFATFLSVRAKDNDGNFYDYIIYLGENKTDDFNIRRNTAMTLNITIEGTSQADFRVHTYTVSFEAGDWFYHNGKYHDIHKYLWINTDSDFYNFKVKVRIDCVDNSKVWINDVHTNELVFDAVVNDYVDIHVRTTFDLITTHNENATYCITLIDNLGNTLEFEGATRLHNFIFLRPEIINSAVGANITNIQGAYSVQLDGSNKGFIYMHLRVFNNENTIKISSTNTPGWMFIGWYHCVVGEGCNLFSDFQTLIVQPSTREMEFIYKSNRY